MQIVFQYADTALNPSKPIEDILGRPLTFYHGMRGKARDVRIDELLDMVKLPRSVRHRHPSGLSGGQKQRIGLARALFGEPFFVLLDEPNSNLDSEGEAALRNAIGDIRARGGIVVVIAHRPSAIESINLVMVMSNGRMFRFGTKEEVLAQILRQNIHQVPAAEEETRKIENRVSENG